MITQNTPSYKDILRELDIPITNHIKLPICNPKAVTGYKNTFISPNLTLLKYLDNGVLIFLRYQDNKFMITLSKVKKGGFNEA